MSPQQRHPEEEEDPGIIRADKLVREAEAAKARLFELPGEIYIRNNGVNRRRSYPPRNLDVNQPFVHSMMVDETYSIVTMHVAMLLIKRSLTTNMWILPS